MHKESDNAPHGDLISTSDSIWDYMKKQKKLRPTKYRRTVATSPRHQESVTVLYFLR